MTFAAFSRRAAAFAWDLLSIGAQLMVPASLLIMVIDGRLRALHDWAAGTLVVEERS